MKNVESALKDKEIWTGVKTLVISLGPTPRNSGLLRQLGHQGIHAQMVQAVDGRSWAQPFDPRLVDVKRYLGVIGRMPSGPEIGCALSHLECARQAKLSSAEYALVFEEDANVVADLAPAVKAMRRIDSSKPTVLTLYAGPEPIFKRNSVETEAVDKSAIVGQFYVPPVCTVAYLMNRAAIDVFASKPIVEGMSDWPPFANQFKFWGYFPFPVAHTLDGSTLETERNRLTLKTDHRTWFSSVVSSYLTLFRLSKMREHSRSVGGLRAYIIRVIGPRSLLCLRRFNQERRGSEPDWYWVG